MGESLWRKPCLSAVVTAGLFFCSNFGKCKNKFDKMYSLLYYFYEIKMKLPAESVIDRIIAPGMSSVRVKGVA